MQRSCQEVSYKDLAKIALIGSLYRDPFKSLAKRSLTEMLRMMRWRVMMWTMMMSRGRKRMMLRMRMLRRRKMMILLLMLMWRRGADP